MPSFALTAHPAAFLCSLIAIGAIVAAALTPRLAHVEPSRLARGFLIAVVCLMGIRIAAWVAANVFGLNAVRPAGTGPFDATNLLIGAIYGAIASQAIRGSGVDRSADRADVDRGNLDLALSAPETQLAMQVATGVAFVLAGLGAFLFTLRTGVDYFVQIGYPKTFHLFIMCAEVLGGALLLLPWRWLILMAAAGLTIDMFGALYTQIRVNQPFDAAAFAMLFCLLPLALLTIHLRRRWIAIAFGAATCAIIAIAGSHALR